MIYPIETWDKKTQAMGQFQRVTVHEDDATVQGLEEVIIISEDTPRPGSYVAHYRFILRAYLPI